MAKERTTVTEAEGHATPDPELLDIAELRKKYHTSRAVFSGVCAVQGWKPGKLVAEADYFAAVAAFNGAPLSSGNSAKEAKRYGA